MFGAQIEREKETLTLSPGGNRVHKLFFLGFVDSGHLTNHRALQIDLEEFFSRWRYNSRNAMFRFESEGNNMSETPIRTDTPEKKFLAFIYPEIKDLATHFITLVSGVLVF